MRDEVVALLGRHVAADPREEEHRTRMLALLTSEAPFDRRSYEPGHFTASAFVLSPERDALALIFHKKLRIWVQPGGHVEPGDGSLCAAARREVGEEIGVPLEEPDCGAALFDVDVHSIPARPGEPAHEHFDARFRLVATSRTLAPNDEVERARWVAFDDVDRFATDESVRRAVRKLRATIPGDGLEKEGRPPDR
jgi:8-oxo-dGTP pyrophosphatase MutT (NUDIX family)